MTLALKQILFNMVFITCYAQNSHSFEVSTLYTQTASCSSSLVSHIQPTDQAPVQMKFQVNQILYKSKESKKPIRTRGFIVFSARDTNVSGKNRKLLSVSVELDFDLAEASETIANNSRSLDIEFYLPPERLLVIDRSEHNFTGGYLRPDDPMGKTTQLKLSANASNLNLLLGEIPYALQRNIIIPQAMNGISPLYIHGFTIITKDGETIEVEKHFDSMLYQSLTIFFVKIRQ